MDGKKSDSRSRMKKPKLFIGGLPTLISKEELTDTLNRIARITNLSICKDRQTGISKGYAFFTVYNPSELDLFLEKKINVQGRFLECQVKDRQKMAKKKSGNGEKLRLFISNLPIGTTDVELRAAFKPIEGLKAVYPIKNMNGVPKRFGFADFYDEKSLLLAFHKRITILVRGMNPTITIFEKKSKLKSIPNQQENHYSDQKVIKSQSKRAGNNKRQHAYTLENYGYQYEKSFGHCHLERDPFHHKQASSYSSKRSL